MIIVELTILYLVVSSIFMVVYFNKLTSQNKKEIEDRKAARRIQLEQLQSSTKYQPVQESDTTM